MKDRFGAPNGGHQWSLARVLTLVGLGVAMLVAPVTASAQNGIESAAQSFAGAWGSGSVDRLSSLLSPSGIRLQLDGASHGSLSARQASAVLRDFLGGYEGGVATVSRAAPVDGSRDRGFAEIRWTSRLAGTSQELNRNLFVGMKFEEDGWRVDELRLLR